MDSRLERADFRPGRLDFTSHRTDFRSDRADFNPKRAWGDGQTGKITPVFPYGAAAQKHLAQILDKLHGQYVVSDTHWPALNGCKPA